MFATTPWLRARSPGRAQEECQDQVDQGRHR